MISVQRKASHRQPIFQPGHHYEELDSLRGLAAIAVLFTHFSNLFLVQSGPFVSIGRALHYLELTPLFILFSGHEAVMLFFVHSGFVLSLQFFKGKNIGYRAFVLRRVFRIYVPYIVTVGVAILCCDFLYSGHISDLSNWFNTPWSNGIKATSVASHLLFLGSFKSDQFDPVLWSLVHEMRISLLFPFLVALLLKRTWKVHVMMGAVLSFIGMTATLALIKFGMHVDYFLTIHYILMFICGFVLAQNINRIYLWYNTLRWLSRAALGLAGFCMYTFSHVLPGRLRYFEDIPITLGAALMIITAVCSAGISGVLKRRVLVFFGKISYSLYLYHAVVLLSLIHALYGRIPVPLILSLAGATTVLVSWLSYKYIELPAIRCGRICSAWLENPKPQIPQKLPPSLTLAPE